jgi:hypothetical protein
MAVASITIVETEVNSVLPSIIAPSHFVIVVAGSCPVVPFSDARQATLIQEGLHAYPRGQRASCA